MTISILPTMAAAQAATLSGSTSVQLMGYYDDGDCSGRIAVYENIGMTAPSTGSNGYGWFKSNDGYYFLLTNDEIDARMFGAKADDATDNASVLNSLMLWAGVDPNTTYYDFGASNPGTKTIVIGSSSLAMGVLSPVNLSSGIKFIIEAGGELKALTDFSGNAVVIGAGTYLCLQVVVEGPGTINGNGITDIVGIQAYEAASWSIGGYLRIIGCDGGGVLGGHVSGQGAGKGYDVDVTEIWIIAPEGTYPATNNANGFGVYYNDISDSYVTNVMVVGYRTGFSDATGDVHFVKCHAWTGAGYGPLVYPFYWGGYNGTAVDCLADTPTPMQDESITAVYGYYAANGGVNITNSSVFINYDNTETLAYSTDVCTAFYSASDGLQELMTVDGGQIASATTSIVFASVFGGAVASISRNIPCLINAPYSTLGDLAPMRDSSYARVDANKKKNFCVNSNFQLWQRGTSINVPSSVKTWGPDRWAAYGDGTSPTRTISQDAISSTERLDYGVRSAFACRVTQSVAPTGGTFFSLYQFYPQEMIYELAGKDVVLQFKAKVVSGTLANFNGGVQLNFGSGGSSQIEASGESLITPTMEYQLISIPLQIPPLLSSTSYGTGANALIYLGLQNTGTYEIDFVDVSLTKGREVPLYDAPTLAETQAEAFQYYETVNAEGFNGTTWYGCTVLKRNAASVSISNGVGSGSPALVGTCQKNGALVSDTTTEPLTLTFSCSEP